MRIRLNPAMLGLMAVAIPAAAFADRTGTVTLSANTALSLDTGISSSSVGDIFWNGDYIAPQSSATTYNIGATEFSALTQSTLSSFSSHYGKSVIGFTVLAIGDVFAVHTNGGNYAAVLVTGIANRSITISSTSPSASIPAPLSPSSGTITATFRQAFPTPASPRARCSSSLAPVLPLRAQ